MTLRSRLEHLFKTLLLERPAARRGLKGERDRLEAGGTKLAQRLSRLPDGAANRTVLQHIIAIERWGQRRLEVALGEPLLSDSNLDYKPPEETSWNELQRQFAETRAGTLALADALIDKRADAAQTVPHSQLGPLSLAGWLRYLNLHGTLEARRIR